MLIVGAGLEAEGDDDERRNRKSVRVKEAQQDASSSGEAAKCVGGPEYY